MKDEELREKIRLAQKGDLKARNEAIVGTMRMVRTIVTKFAEKVGRADLIDDMCQEAIFGGNGKRGIVRAIELYNTDGKEKFSAFATKYILSECDAMCLPSMISPDQRRARTRAKKALLKGKGGNAKLAQEMSVGEVFEVSVNNMWHGRHTRDTTGLHRQGPSGRQDKQEDEHSLNEDYDTIKPDNLHNNEILIAEMIDGDDKRALLMAALDLLPHKQRYVITALCGFNGRSFTHQEIADKLGTSRINVAALVGRAKIALKKIFKKLEAVQSLTYGLHALTSGYKSSSSSS